MGGAPPDDGWSASADAWIASLGDEGDYGRRFVLDAPMTARVAGRGFARALDVGCGEGRFCRTLRALGLETVGIDPTEALIAAARRRDPHGDYRVATAESPGVTPVSFDLAVCYLSLIDVPDLAAALASIAAALRPGGTLLIANLTSFNSAAMPHGWTRDSSGREIFGFDRYLEERAVRVSWRGIRVLNHHRPLSTYVAALLAAGFELRHFAEPAASGDPAAAERYDRAPWFYVTEWQKRA